MMDRLSVKTRIHSSETELDSGDKTLYVLRLEGKIHSGEDAWYVGVTENLERRLKQHFDGKGARWTEENPPKECVLVVEEVDKYAETELTLELMTLHGWKHVRGGPWTKVNLSKPNPIV